MPVSASTTVLTLRVYPQDARRWRRMIGREKDPHSVKKPGGKMGIRVYLKDKQRWKHIVKRAALSEKKAADVFSEMLDLVDRRRNHLLKKKIRLIFSGRC